MGCGKSSVGRRLSELLCCPFMDLDQVIEEREGRTIPEIFSQDGEATFRQMELDALKQIIAEMHKTSLRGAQQRGNLFHSYPTQVTARRNTKESVSLILALGGGAVMTAECAEIVHSETKCIYLRASIDTLIEHLEGQTGNRPLLSQEVTALRDRITDLMGKRASTYEKTAHVMIDIDGKSIEAVASEIISIIREELV